MGGLRIFARWILPKPEFIRRNIGLASAFSPMPEAERRRLTDSIVTECKAALAEFFRDHRDA